jgi:hypothetical protein
MEPMSFWQLVENSPEWVAVFASIVFGLATTGVIVWQVFVMKAQVRVMQWQARSSTRHERTQNRLIRLQHEHEWVRQKNQERREILNLARKLHVVVGCLRRTPAEDDRHYWGELQDAVHQLHERLSILDLSVYSSPYDGWYFTLNAYVEALLQAVFNDEPSDSTYAPNLSTRSRLGDAENEHNPIKILLDLEAAIRMDFFDFKQEWDAALPA